MLEEHLRRAMIISRGDPSVFFTRPLSAALLLASVAVLAVVLMPSVSKKREQIFQEDD
jgi:TctA family transporter